MKNELVPIKGKPELAQPVPDGTKAGQVVPLGADGLEAVTETAQTTAAMIAEGKSPQGLEPGQASCMLLGVCGVLVLPLVTPIQIHKPVFRAADGTYTATAEGNKKIGYALKTLAALGDCDVAIIG